MTLDRDSLRLRLSRFSIANLMLQLVKIGVKLHNSTSLACHIFAKLKSLEKQNCPFAIP